MVLVGGRAIGFAAAFAIPVVLARVFTTSEFGTYKQLFLLFSTLFGIAQLGMAESLYYFLPRSVSGEGEQSSRDTADAGRHVANAVATIALAGAACLALLWANRGRLGAWLGNAQLSDYVVLLGLLLALMLVTTVFEIVMISRHQHVKAAVTYAVSDLARTLLFVVPAVGFRSLHGVLVGAVAFGILRLAAMLAYLRREFGRELRIDVKVWRRQLAYALPFALAVGIEVVQLNFHQYVVAARFDTATFAIYAVGCLQIPLVDLVMTSTVSVMMVQMAEHARTGDRRAALALWHDTVYKLAALLFPLAVFLFVAARPVIVALFTARYLASVPIFMVWTLTVLPAAFAVDGVLRVYAQTRFLLVMNLVRFALVVVLVLPLLSGFGLAGAVLVTLLATSVAKAIGAARITRLLGVGLADAVPWGRLLAVTARALAAAVPAAWIIHSAGYRPIVLVPVAGAAFFAAYAALTYGSLRGAGGQVFAAAPGRRLAGCLVEEADKELSTCAASRA
jgi:O-antigen/teichoic acid export membrane protein